jgi:hypothetical protein
MSVGDGNSVDRTGGAYPTTGNPHGSDPALAAEFQASLTRRQCVHVPDGGEGLATTVEHVVVIVLPLAAFAGHARAAEDELHGSCYLAHFLITKLI